MKEKIIVMPSFDSMSLADFLDLDRGSLEDVASKFVHMQAEGALKNGTRIRKINSNFAEDHPNGSPGVIVGSIGPGVNQMYGYFVIWDDNPEQIVFMTSTKIREDK
jgi:hypothetical protein